MSESTDDEDAEMLVQESIALNPTRKVGSELLLASSAGLAGGRDRRLHRRRDRLVRAPFDDPASNSIIRHLLNHPTGDTAEQGNGEIASHGAHDAHEMREAVPTVDAVKYKAKMKALSEWNNLANMDQFLELVYDYYREGGHRPLVLSSVFNLAKLGFMIVFAATLAYGVDWTFLHKPATAAEHPRLWEVLSVRNFFANMSLFGVGCIVVFGGFWGLQLFRVLGRLPLYDQVARFYNCLLEIGDAELGDSVSFGEVCERITRLHATHKVVGDRLDARDICNRIMRRDNYLIALFNRDIMQLGAGLPSLLRDNSRLMTRILEWNIAFCLLGFVFEGEGNAIRVVFLKTTQRDRLAGELRRRFQLLALLNLLLAPFVLVFILVYFLFRYGEEFYRTPSSVTERQYAPYARWTLREFNELEHVLDRRLAASHKKATRYLEAFVEPRYTAAAKFVSFVAGSVVLVLLLVTVGNEDLLMHFELTEGKSVIWYLGCFGAVLAVSRAMIPNRRALQHDKTELLAGVSEHLHYCPESWMRRPESTKVRDELAGLLRPRHLLFVQELAGLLLNPFILYVSLPDCSERIVEFFREFSVHVDGLGYVCSFALFDFKRHGERRLLEGATGSTVVPETGFLQSRQAKMEKSFLSFKAHHPTWQSDEDGSVLLANLAQFELAEGNVERVGVSDASGVSGGATRRVEAYHDNVIYEEEMEQEEMAASAVSILERYRASSFMD